MKIDSHQHFWIYNSNEYKWISDEMRILKNDFLPEQLKFELSNINFDGSIVVQARQSIEETEWILKLAAQNDFIKGVVGWVDLCANDIENQLRKFSLQSKFVGVRHVIHDEEDINFMLRDDFLKGISFLSKYKLSYDILIFPKHLENTIKFVSKFPEQTFVLDHIAKPLIKDKSMSPWKENINKLAQHKNIFCKLSGMVTEADANNWTQEDFRPYLDVIFDAFGSNRLMIGSDWPVCTLGGTYNDIMNIVFSYIEPLSINDKNKIMGENAIKAYNIK